MIRIDANHRNVDERKQLTLGSLFDGIGGFPLAASALGIQTLWASEILPTAVAITKRHFPDMEHLGDVKQLNGQKMMPVDIITFGSPCQGLSMAGMRMGLADGRSALFNEAIRIIWEMREATYGEYPRVVLWENVPGAFSTAGGSDFRTVLESLTKAQIPMPPSGKWANAGMVRSGRTDVAWCVYDAQHFGVPQRRRRIFLIADFRGRGAGEILFVPKSLRWYFEAGSESKKGAAPLAQSGTDPARTREMPYCEPGIARTLTARGDSSPCIDRGQNIIVEGKIFCSATAQANTEILENLCPTIVAGHEQPLLTHPVICGTLCGSGAGTARMSGMKNEPDFCVVTAVDCRNLRECRELSGTIQGKTTGGYSLNYQNPVRIGYVVRRLTPIECERLQGYPDNWTQYGADGKLISDSKRYQMLGNSIAVPCAVYIMEGIAKALHAERR